MEEKGFLFVPVTSVFITATSTGQMLNNYLLDRYRIHFSQHMNSEAGKGTQMSSTKPNIKRFDKM